eukprot:7633123-Ditylum_brightwellii.AAC.1
MENLVVKLVETKQHRCAVENHERTALLAVMLMFARFFGRYAEENLDGEVITADEWFAARAVDHCFLRMVGDKKVVELE